jgi:hypothetical protein
MAKFNSSTARDAGLKSGEARRDDGSKTQGNDGAAYVDPRAAAAAAGEPSEPAAAAKRREPAAPSGGAAPLGKRPSKASPSLDLSALGGVLQGAHAIIAYQRQEPHWLLNDDDSKKYGTALANALRHLPIKTAQKTVDYAALVMIAFVIETPRVVRSAQLARAPKAPPRGPAQVFQFHSPSPANPPPAQGTASPAEPSPGSSPPAASIEPDFGTELDSS